MVKTTPRERTQKRDEKLLEVVAAAAWPGDWTEYEDGAAGLSTVGAERLLKHFPIEFTKWLWNREEWKDGQGVAFAWTYRAHVRHGKSQIMAEGRYSNRDPFWRDPNYESPQRDETDIRAGSRHLCVADGIKSILGIRKVPVEKLVVAGLERDKIGKPEKDQQRGRPQRTQRSTKGSPQRG